MKKKWLALGGLFLALAVVGTVVWGSDLFRNIEVGDYTYRIRGEQGVIQEYTGKESHIAVPESFEWEGETYSVAHVGREAFAGDEQLESIFLGENIETIGDRAFFGCSALTRVEFFGDAPEMGDQIFEGTPAALKLLYAHDRDGFGTEFGYPAEPFYYVEYLDHLSEGGVLPVDETHYALGDAVLAKINEGGLVRTGYTLKGWTTNPGGEGILIPEGESFAVSEETTKLYPFWEKNKYTVAFQTMGAAARASLIVEHGERLEEPQDPEKKGALFLRWTWDEGGENPWDFAGQEVLGETTLYAQWLNVPATPGGLKTSIAGIDQIKIQWNKASHAHAYEVYRSEQSGGSYVKIGEAVSTSFVDNDRPYQVTFYYKVKATAAAYGVSAESNLSASASGKAELLTPSGFQGVRKEPQGVTLRWAATPGAVGYEVYGSTSPNGTYDLLDRVETTSFTDLSAKWTESHYYKIRAYHSGSGTERYSGYTGSKGFYRVGDQLADYMSSLSNRNSVNEAARILRGGHLHDACVYFSAEALRRVGVPIRTTMGSIDYLLPYLSNNGWVKNRDYTQLRKGDLCFTTDGAGDPNGRPTHVFIFMGWVTPGDYSQAYICDNQSPYYEDQVLHVRYMLEKHDHNGEEKEAFSFFMTMR